MRPTLLFWNLLQAPGLLTIDNPRDIDNAKEEHEGYGSKIDSVYDGLQKKSSDIFNVRNVNYFWAVIANFFHYFKTKPLVDGIKEAQKYGNNGEPFVGLGKLVVSVMSVASNVLNKVIDVSFDERSRLKIFINFYTRFRRLSSLFSRLCKPLTTRWTK